MQLGWGDPVGLLRPDFWMLSSVGCTLLELEVNRCPSQLVPQRRA